MTFVPEQDVLNIALITSLFGEWPCFHDAELLRVTLQREKGSASLECVIHIFNPHTLVTLRFGDLDLERLVDFNHQNVLYDLKIESSADGATKRFTVDMPASNGFDATFLCDTIRIVSVQPYPIQQHISDGSVSGEPQLDTERSLISRAFRTRE